MPTTEIKHPGHREVGRLMHRVVELYFEDVRPLADLTADQIFDYVEKIPYAYDRDIFGPGNEALVRPARFRELKGLDCKKKAILIACWAKYRNIGYRFIAVDDTGNGITHVFCEVEEAPGYWVTMDATVSGLFRPGSPMPNVKQVEVI